MKKIAFLLAMLCMGGMGFAQSYDYDRIPPEQQAPLLWFTPTLGEQMVPLPDVATNQRIVLFEEEVNTGDFLFEFHRTSDEPPQVHVSVTPMKNGLNVHDMKAMLMKFLLEENGETVTSLDGNTKGYLPSYLIKMVWRDAQGKSHKKYIGKVY